MTVPLITADALRARLDCGEDLVILDVRWRIDRPDGRDDFLAGHVPGAVYVDLEAELGDHTAIGRGRHPLPSGARLTAAGRGWGVRTGVPVVVYDACNSVPAARAWWLLTAAGHHDVVILDGGWPAWQGSGGVVETGEVEPRRGDIDFVAVDFADAALKTTGVDGAAEWPRDGVLVDARAGERFRGEVEPIDPVAGHIPGAVNVPAADVVDAEGRFLPVDALRERFAAAGIDGSRRVAAYCGSGINASQLVVALRLVGIDAALFPGSWSEWTSDPGRPVAVGSR
jgi:thiosulfate/3-mercaptopyruvate sulfurtransferase